MEETVLRELWAKTVVAPLEDPQRTYKPAALEATLVEGPRASSAAAVPAPPADRYEIQGELGRGGMGIVYRARQASLRREVALKLVLSSAADARARFVAEALVTGALDHPNIVPVHELDVRPAGEVALAMKLVRGVSWKDLLHPKKDEHRARAKELDLPAHLGILHAVANAVAFAHSKNILHRDLKPENVMVGEFGEVLVMDWGLAVSTEATPDPASPIPHARDATGPAGTPCYMAPELAEGRGADQGPWTDVYLLGAILHELVTGGPPHSGPSAWKVLLSACQAAPPVLDASVPAELQVVIKKALAARPADRYATVRELQAAVGEYLAHRQSLVVSDTARVALARAEQEARGAAATEAARARAYALFAEAVAGFRQARVLWEANPSAREGEAAARVAYASFALGAGDLGLAQAQAESLPERPDLARRVQAAREERAAAALAARRTRVVARALVAAIVVGLAAGFALVSREKDRADVARDAADSARAVAETERGAAERARDRAAAESRRADANAREASEQASRALANLDRANRNLASVFLEKADRAAELRDAREESALLARALLLDRSSVTRSRLIAAREGVPILRAVTPARSSGLALLAFSPAGDRVATAGALRTGVEVWDARTGQQLAALPARAAPAGVAFVGSRLLVARGVRLELEDRDGVELVSSLPAPAAALAVAGGRCALALSDGTLRLQDTNGGAVVSSRTFGEQPSCLALLPDGRAVAGGVDGTVRILDAGGRVTILRGHKGAVLAATAGPDGALVTASADRTVRAWDLASGTATRTTAVAVAGRVSCLALQPGGALVAGPGDAVGRIVLADARTGLPAATLEGAAGPALWTLAFAADGRTLASLAQDGTLTLWDVRTDERGVTAAPRLRSTGHRGSIDVVALSPDRKHLAIGGGSDAVEVLDARTLAVVKTLALPMMKVATGLAWSPDGARLAVSQEGGHVGIFDLATGERARLGEHGERVRVAWSADGLRLATGGLGDRRVGVWDPAAPAGKPEGRILAARRATTSVGTLAWVSEPRRLLYTEHGKILSWDPGGTEEPALVARNDEDVLALAVCPADGRTLAAACEGRVLRISRVEQDRYRDDHPVALPEPAISLAWSPSGRTLALGTRSGRVQFWDGVSFMAHPDANLTGLAWTSEEDLLTAGSDGHVRAWRLPGGRASRRHGWATGASWIDARSLLSWEYSATRVVDVVTGAETAGPETSWTIDAGVRPDGSAVFATPDGTLLLAGGRAPPRRWRGEELDVLPIGLDAASERYAVAHPTGTVCVWPIEGKKELATLRGAAKGGPGHGEAATAAAFHRGWLATGSRDRTARVWDLATGSLVQTLEHTGPVTALAWSPDGRTLVTAALEPGFRAFDARTGAVVRRFAGHGPAKGWSVMLGQVAPGSVHSLDFAPDGRMLASAASDEHARLWDAATGEQLLDLSCDAKRVRFSPDGGRLAVVDGVGLVVWDVKELERLLRASPEELLEATLAETALEVGPTGVVHRPANRLEKP